MIKRTVEISSGPTHLSISRKQLVIKQDGDKKGQIPCEDIGVVVIDQPATTCSISALSSLMNANASFIICGSDHLPQGMLIPFANHTQVVSRLQTQIEAAKPLKKRLWKQIVQAKILAQSDNLQLDSAPWRLLRNLSGEVKSGDSSNVEAHAAKIYWKHWLTLPDEEGLDTSQPYKRERYGEPPNGLLNYGYAVLRAAVARAIVSAGLLPALGIHHSNRSNAFCLADDLMEPLRPIVDLRVRELVTSGENEVNRYTKEQILDLLTLRIEYKEHTGPLMVSLHHYVASFVRCLERTDQNLEIPRLCTSADTEVCG